MYGGKVLSRWVAHRAAQLAEVLVLAVQVQVAGLAWVGGAVQAAEEALWPTPAALLRCPWRCKPPPALMNSHVHPQTKERLPPGEGKKMEDAGNNSPITFFLAIFRVTDCHQNSHFSTIFAKIADLGGLGHLGGRSDFDQQYLDF